MIKAILCDIGNVMVFFNHELTTKGLAKYSDKDAKYIGAFFLKSKARKKFDIGKLSADELFQNFKLNLNLKLSFEKFKEIWCSCFTSKNADLENLLRKLKNKYRLILLSNTDKIHFNYVKGHYKFMGIFDDFVLSYKVGCLKPNPLIYFNAIRKAKAFPTKIVYIDDMKNYVLAAKFFGIKGIHYTGFEKLKSDLNELNVKI